MTKRAVNQDGAMATGIPQPLGDPKPSFSLYGQDRPPTVDFRRNRDLISAAMTPVKIAERQELAREWKPN